MSIPKRRKPYEARESDTGLAAVISPKETWYACNRHVCIRLWDNFLFSKPEYIEFGCL